MQCRASFVFFVFYVCLQKYFSPTMATRQRPQQERSNDGIPAVRTLLCLLVSRIARPLWCAVSDYDSRFSFLLQELHKFTPQRHRHHSHTHRELRTLRERGRPPSLNKFISKAISNVEIEKDGPRPRLTQLNINCSRDQCATMLATMLATTPRPAHYSTQHPPPFNITPRFSFPKP